MTVCKFYQQGTCKFGDNCRFEHPGHVTQANRNINQNRFGPLTGQGDRYQPPRGGFGGRGGNRRGGYGRETYRHGLSPSTLEEDLRERPQWPLSAYSPGRDVPKQLIEGELEMSPEELRWEFYKVRGTGLEANYIQQEQELTTRADQQIKTILSNPHGALKYIDDGFGEPNNRLEMIQRQPQTEGLFSVANRTRQNQNTSTSRPPFGAPPHPSTFDRPASPAFGQSGFSAFGQTANQSSAFGQSSAMGQPSAFGKPSRPGQSQPTFGQSTFGQPSQPGGASAFGKPAFSQPSQSAFGQSTFGQASNPGQAAPAFGQPSNPGQTTSAFGQSSISGKAPPAFGQASNPGQAPSAFGQAPNSGQTSSPFSQSSNTTPAFGQSAFGQPSQPSAFGAPGGSGSGATPFGQQQPQSNANPFGGSNQAAPAFGQPSASTQASPFGQAQDQTQHTASPFGTSQPTTTFGQPSPFGQNPAPTQQSTLFGPGTGNAPTAAPVAAPSPPAAPTAKTNGAVTNGNISHNPSTELTFGPNGQLQSFKGHKVVAIGSAYYYARHPNANPQTHKPDDWQQIYNPSGKPIIHSGLSSVPWREGEPEEYAGEKGKALEEAYRIVRERGTFPSDDALGGAVMPEVPPKSDWVSWAV